MYTYERILQKVLENEVHGKDVHFDAISFLKCMQDLEKIYKTTYYEKSYVWNSNFLCFYTFTF